MLIDFVTELGVGCQIGRDALRGATVLLVADPPPPATNPPTPPTCHVEVSVPGRTVAGKSHPAGEAEAAYGKVVQKINQATANVVLGPAAAGPLHRTPQTEAEAKQLAATVLLLLTIFAHGPNTQALVARLALLTNDPTTWDLILNALLGPPAA